MASSGSAGNWQSAKATASILAAIGTALPESVITFITQNGKSEPLTLKPVRPAH